MPYYKYDSVTVAINKEEALQDALDEAYEKDAQITDSIIYKVEELLRGASRETGTPYETLREIFLENAPEMLPLK